MTFDLVDLRILRVIAERGTLRQAALATGLAQSSASHRIKKLEATLGTTLFVRHRRGLTLTSAGNVVLRHAVMVLSKVSEMDEEISSLNKAAFSDVDTRII